MLLPLKLPPGFYRNGTVYQAKDRWYDGNLVRFHEGAIKPVGGWVRATPDVLDSPGRGIAGWRANNSSRLAAIGTVNALWVWDSDSLRDISPTGFPAGKVDTVFGTGYGTGPYGVGPYGESTGGKSDATTWTLDNFGEDLVACASHDGNIYRWAPADTEAAIVAAAPTNNRAVHVTAERIVVAVGADGNPRQLDWCAQEDLDDWTPSDLNQAGTFNLQTTGNLLRGMRVRGGDLYFTTTDLHEGQYLGYPDVYGFKQVADNCGLIGALAAVALDGGAVWMGYRNFYSYNGGVVRQIPCDVHDRVFSDLNVLQSVKITGAHIAQFSELWWFYPSANSDVLDRYVMWNYRTGHWTTGTLARSCWLDAGVFPSPIATDDAGNLYEHETDWTADGADRTTSIFVESGPLEMGNGDTVMSVRRVISDATTPGAWRLDVIAQFSPEGDEYAHGPYVIMERTPVRFKARQMRVRFSLVRDEDARLGTMRLDVESGGRR